MNKIGTTNVNKELLDAFSYYDDKNAATVLKSAITEDDNDHATHLRWSAVRSGTEAMTFDELTRVVRAFNDNGLTVQMEKLPKAKSGVKTPLSDPAFLNSLAHHFEDPTALHEQLQLLHGQCLQEQGFLKKTFGIFSSQDPLATVMHDVAQFEDYCRDNHITFNAETQQLEIGDHPKDVKEKLWENRFLVAAAAGVVTGMAGIDPGGASDVLKEYPNVFFGKALQWMVVPYTGLSIFNVLNKKDSHKEFSILGRFAALMTLGAALSITNVNMMLDNDNKAASRQESVALQSDLPEIKSEKTTVGTVRSEDKSVLQELWDFKPSSIIMDVVMAGVLAGVGFQLARRKIEAEKSNSKDGILSSEWNMAAIGIDKTSHTLKSASDFIGNNFGKVLTVGGLPAVYLSLANNVAEHGLMAQVEQYGGLYKAMATTMGESIALACVGLYALGARSKEDWKAIYEVASTAWGTSSGVATVPIIQKTLEQFGVSENSRNHALTATNFDMVGPTNCVLAGALYALASAGFPQTLAEQATTALSVLAIMIGIRGVPGSTGAMMAPVLERSGMPEALSQNVQNGIFGVDRLWIDPMETTTNVLWDMVALGWHEKGGYLPTKRAFHVRENVIEPPKPETP